jgi:hypothetical protein
MLNTSKNNSMTTPKQSLIRFYRVGEISTSFFIFKFIDIAKF